MTNLAVHSGAWCLRGMAVALVFCVFSFEVRAELVRYHGIDLDEQSKIMVEERADQLLLFIAGRTRVPGGPIERVKPDGGIESTFRVTDREVLVRIRTETLRTAPPNYLSNPGLRYRIIIEGVDIEPNLAVVHEVDATQVRRVITAELAKVGARAGGNYRDAMHYGAPLVLGVLKAAGKIPPEVPLTIERSEVGRIRGLDVGLERRALPGGRSLNPLHTEGESNAPERSFVFDVAPGTEPETDNAGG